MGFVASIVLGDLGENPLQEVKAWRQEKEWSGWAGNEMQEGEWGNVKGRCRLKEMAMYVERVVRGDYFARPVQCLGWM